MPNLPEPRHLRLTQTDAGSVIQFVECRSLDEQNTPHVECELFRLVEQLGAVTLLLDFSGIGFMTSIGIGMLLGVHRRLKKCGGHLSVVGVNEEIYEVIEVSGLIKLLNVCRDKPPGP